MEKDKKQTKTKRNNRIQKYTIKKMKYEAEETVEATPESEEGEEQTAES